KSRAEGDWFATVSALALKGMSLELARNCVMQGWEGDTLNLELDAAYKQLHTDQAAKRLTEALGKHFGKEVKPKITAGQPSAETPAQTRDRKSAERVAQARGSLADDPNLKSLTDTFGTSFDPEAVRPLD